MMTGPLEDGDEDDESVLGMLMTWSNSLLILTESFPLE